ncbi:hypothetical protein [Spirosoma sp. KUDC1026]|uniref:hypothetical protein n=1 Tax=Spirosoma sp. KUDC1026 TaxID=2745947 RepID=UPI00159BDDD1|nr:hypothetical protein [Spirosoma sp. KUDC1026]QKZ13689.1 hypothetical protein HU175_14025 [Spirosoma sp. KUDC1026]
MQGNTGTIRLWVHLLGSFLTAWLLALLPGKTDSRPVEDRQYFVASLTEQDDGTDQSTCSAALLAHTPAACVSSWPGASPSLAFLPQPLAAFSSNFLCLLNRPLQASFFSFSFIRQIFRYQIAINAP